MVIYRKRIKEGEGREIHYYVYISVRKMLPTLETFLTELVIKLLCETILFQQLMRRMLEMWKRDGR